LGAVLLIKASLALSLLGGSGSLLGGSGCSAQVDRAGLNGTVTDSAGKRIPGAQIVILQVETGLKRETISSASGVYDIPELPIGLYRVTCSAAGFKEFLIEGLEQTVGRTRTLNITLAVGSMTQQVNVKAHGSQLDETTDTLGARTEAEQVRELPLNGRNWSTLTALAPGAVDTGGSNQRSIRFAGRGLDDNNFTYDGIDATNIVNQAQQAFVRLAIPTDAIEEFHIDTMLFTAENGSTPGGQVDVASKFGTNTPHGSLFEFLRNDVLDARDPILPARLPFHLNQFGGDLGGRLVRDRSFYFFNYEGLRQSYGQPLSGFVPSPSFGAQIVAANPALAPIVAAYPTTGLAPFATDIDQFTGSGRQRDHEDSAMLRLDQHFSAADTAYLRFNFDAAASSVPSDGLNDRQLTTSRPVNGELEALHIFSPKLVNELKFGFNRSTVFTTNQGHSNLPYSVAVAGLTTLANNELTIGVGNSFSYIDNLTMVRGAHTLKFGVEVRRIQLDQGNSANGTVVYSSLNLAASSFLVNSVSSATYNAALPLNGLRKTEVYSYAQDEWKFRPNLTLNLGVRYSFYNIFHEVHGKADPFDFATCGAAGFCGVGASFGNPNTLDVDPRVSVAWSPGVLGAGKTVIRSGFGLYHGDGQLDDQNVPIKNEVGAYSLSAKSTPGLSYPITPFLNGPGTISANADYRDRKDMYAIQWGLSVQRALPHDFAGTLSYVGSKGNYVLITSYVNLINPATGLRPYPAFGQVRWRGNSNSSSYDGFVASLQRNFTGGLLISANYTYSHQIDQDAPGGGDSDNPQNPVCMPCERASGDFDARQVVNANAVYDLPFGPGKAWLAQPGIASAIFGRWSVTDIVAARTGTPLNVTYSRSSSTIATGYTTNQRPNLVPGVSLTPPGGKSISGTTMNWINPAAFIAVTDPDSYGNTPRNIARGPSLWQTDLGVSKRIPLTERTQLQFRCEAFNLFNRAQYSLPLEEIWLPPSGTTQASIEPQVSTASTTPIGTGTPREIQFALRLEF
jgi:carboxypeptidase family protein/TonB-dependent receptor-like protein